jgi:hypothetical protein
MITPSLFFVPQNTTLDGQPAYKLVLEDRYALVKSAVLDAKCDDLVPLAGYRTADGYIIAEFSRDLIATDPQDRSVLPGKQGVIWAWGDSTSVGYHGPNNRGTSVIVFIEDDTTKSSNQPASSTYFDIPVPSIKIPTIETAYWCTSTKIPSSVGTDPIHITDIDLIVPTDSTAAALVHHILV